MFLNIPNDCFYIIIANCNTSCLNGLSSSCKKTHSLIFNKKIEIFKYISVHDKNNYLIQYEIKRYAKLQHRFLNDIHFVRGVSLKIAYIDRLFEHMHNTKYILPFAGIDYIETAIKKLNEIEEDYKDNKDVMTFIIKYDRLKLYLLHCKHNLDIYKKKKNIKNNIKKNNANIFNNFKDYQIIL
jgi:hypothetical protein